MAPVTVVVKPLVDGAMVPGKLGAEFPHDYPVQLAGRVPPEHYVTVVDSINKTWSRVMLPAVEAQRKMGLFSMLKDSMTGGSEVRKLAKFREACAAMRAYLKKENAGYSGRNGVEWTLRVVSVSAAGGAHAQTPNLVIIVKPQPPGAAATAAEPRSVSPSPHEQIASSSSSASSQQRVAGVKQKAATQNQRLVDTKQRMAESRLERERGKLERNRERELARQQREIAKQESAQRRAELLADARRHADMVADARRRAEAATASASSSDEPASDVFIADIELGEKLGEGVGGAVYKGRWQGTTAIALKKLSGDMAASEREEFLNESKLLQRLRHPHIVMFIGIYVEPDTSEQFIATEWMPHGSLLALLSDDDDDDELSARDKVLMARDAAAGLACLHSVGVVHRDIAARNLLVKREHGRYVVKVGDLGLSRICNTAGGRSYVPPRGQPVNVAYKWCAPEIFAKKVFSGASDIWALAITVLCELFGDDGDVPLEPFIGLGVQQVKRFVLGGGVPPQPSACPDAVYAIVRDCLHRDAEVRLSARQLFARLDLLARDAEQDQVRLARDTEPAAATATNANVGDSSNEGVYAPPARIIGNDYVVDAYANIGGSSDDTLSTRRQPSNGDTYIDAYVDVGGSSDDAYDDTLSTRRQPSTGDAYADPYADIGGCQGDTYAGNITAQYADIVEAASDGQEEVWSSSSSSSQYTSGDNIVSPVSVATPQQIYVAEAPLIEAERLNRSDGAAIAKTPSGKLSPSLSKSASSVEKSNTEADELLDDWIEL
jgi:serine/threonine protein kinase